MLQGLRNIGQARKEAHLEPDGAVQQSVGDMLRSRREQYGLDLRDVSNALRIRHPYLTAIEDGRLDDLPGSTYAIGFVRAYADHLGLEGPAVVERYKDETAALANAARLVFPSPLPEGKVPSGKILLVAVLALAAIYGGWILMSVDDRRLADLVPALPDRFLALIGMDETAPPHEAPSSVPDPAPPPAAVPEAVKPPPEEKPGAEGSRDLADASPETRTAPPPQAAVPARQDGGAASADVQPSDVQPAAIQPVTVASDAESAAETTANGQVTGIVAAAPMVPDGAAAVPLPDVPAVEPPSAVQIASGKPVAAPEMAPVKKIVAEDAAPRSDVTAAVAAMDPAPPAIPAAPSESAKEPRQYGTENTNSRVVIRATDDSWVQIRDKEGNLVLTRVLRIGDSYRVPNDPGMVMRTGNAGGLAIQVDGKSVPGLGPIGAIRHEVALDAERLRTGTAISR